MNVIDGKLIAKEIREKIRASVGEKKPGLAFVLIGEDPASQSYVKMKEKACAEVGFYSKVLHLPQEISQAKLIDTIERLNTDPDIHGILVQQPFPDHIDTEDIVDAVDPKKDVDGFHPLNLGLLMQGSSSGFVPCTPLGVVVLLEKSGIDLAGKNVVVLGRSNIVGKPLASLLGQKRCNATVTLAHSRTKDLEEVCANADVLVAAVGRAGFVKKSMVKPGAVVIDVGINRVQGKIVGDVDYASVKDVAGAITPVPGGVGLMTIAMLLQNTLQSFLRCAG